MKKDTSIDDIIQQFFKLNNKEDLLLEGRMPEVWKQVVGPMIAQRTKYKSFVSGTIYIGVHEAALRFELTQLRSSLVEKMNDSLGKIMVKNIVFQ